MSRVFVYWVQRTIDQSWIMKNLSMPSVVLQRRVLALSTRQLLGFTRQIETESDSIALGRLWSGWRKLMAMGQPINQDTLWRAWQGDVPMLRGVLKKGLDRLDKALDNFQSPISQSAIYQLITRLPLGDIVVIENHIANADVVSGGDLIGLFKSLVAFIPKGGEALRFDLWEAWRPGQPFDPAILRNRLTSLQNLIKSHFARLDETKVGKWIAKLDTKERGELERYLAVQGNERRKELIALFRLLVKELNNEAPRLREAFFAAWRGKEEVFKDSKLNSAFNNLLDLVRKYCAFKSLGENAADEIIRVIRFLDARDFSDLLDQELVTARHRLSTLPQDAQSFHRAAELEEAILSQRNAGGRIVKELLDFSESWYWGEQDFLLNALRRYAAAITYDRSLGTRHDLRNLPKVIALAEDPGRPHQALVEAYRWVVRMLTDPDAGHYFLQLKDWLLHGTKSLVPELERELLKYAINYCASRVRIGLVEFEETLARLYDHGLKTQLLLRHAVIDAAELMNIVVILCRTGRLAAARETFEQHRRRLSRATDPVMTVFLEAVLEFWGGELVAARRKFEGAYYSSDIFLKVEARLYVLEILWLTEAFTGEGPAMLSPFEVAYNGLGVFRKGLKGRKELLASINEYGKYMYSFYKLKRSPKKRAEACKQWGTLRDRLAKERVARHLSWLRMQCEKAITDLGCP